ncbi:esterase OVCA2 isoform X1 [Hydra vulgaris]|uniref:esterase OVCA2 isoform X1 n=1 Tax=Hydra vulgaris TaxID=6087 RepID=UPI00064112ED|nr:esterase OVCA2 isoform X1 [Hydra vulgaris]
MESKGKLKVLVIHGYRQCAKTSREKSGSLRKLLKKYIDFVYITAPNKIPSSIDEEYGWWFSKEDMSFNALENSHIDNGHQISVDHITNAFKEHGSFDGILGFSQGATMATHICALSEEDGFPFKIKFAILCAGFKSRSLPHQCYYSKKISCPSLHIYGDSDRVIPKEMSIELQNCFQTFSVIIHSGGHYIPATSKERKDYENFLLPFMKEQTTEMM